MCLIQIKYNQFFANNTNLQDYSQDTQWIVDIFWCFEFSKTLLKHFAFEILAYLNFFFNNFFLTYYFWLDLSW